ncbi:LamB/YcsF family protein [Anaerosporobacter sp.]
MNRVDLNCDLGESFGVYKIGMDEEILPLISSANIACGYHASDPLVMDKTVRLAMESGCGIGAHPGFPDLMGFGRRKMSVSEEEAKAYVIYQIGALDAFCKKYKVKMNHVKAHGAIYNMASSNYRIARAICEAVKEVNPDLILMGLANSQLLKAAQDIGLAAANEVFADRAYNDDGSLVDRSLPNAMITDEDLAVERVVRMVKEGLVKTVTGKDIKIQVDSICVHGDGEKALDFVKKIRKAFQMGKIEIKRLDNLKWIVAKD